MSTVSDGLFQFGGVPVAVNHTGTAYFVHSGTGSAGYTGRRKNRPLATIDQAINKCTASKGDVIYVMEGHAETITAAAGIDADVIGISIIGLGTGRLRPTISFTTANTADVDIDAAQITIENIVFDFTGVAALAAPIDVNAADFTMRNCELIMSNVTNQATRAIVTATAADRMKLVGNTIWSTTAGSTSAINLVGTADGIEILDNTIIGDWSTAAIENATGAGNTMTNLLVDGNYIRNDNTGDWAIELVAATTGNIQNNTFATDAIATAVDWGACAAFNNLYFDTSDTDKNATPIPTAETTGGVDLQTLSDKMGTEAATDPISEVLSGTGGITTWKAAAAPATGVSMSEVLRDAWDVLRNGTGGSEPGSNKSVIDAIGFTGTAFVADGLAGYLPRCVEKLDGAVLTGNDNLFVISGGPVRAKIVGYVTTIIGGASNGDLQIVTTDPAATATLNAAPVAVDSDASGTVYYNVGATSIFTPVTAGVVIIDPVTIEEVEFILPPGTVHFRSSAAQTGNIKWYMTYWPLSPNSRVAAAA